MSVNVGPVQLTVGQTAEIVPPGPTPWGRVVMSNLSPFVCAVVVGANQGWLDPWETGIFQMSSTNVPISLTPSIPFGSAVTPGSSSQAYATFFGPGEQVVGTYPISLSASAVQTTVTGTVAVVNGASPLSVQQGSPPWTVAQSGAWTATVTQGGAWTATVSPAQAGTPVTGRQLVGAGPTQLPAHALARSVTVKALAANAAPVYVGPSTVTTLTGYELAASAATPELFVTNVNDLWIAGGATDGVTFIGS